MAAGRRRLEGKVAIVAGAGSSAPGVGSGKAMSILFAREGASVLLVDRVDAQARETLGLIEAEGGHASVFIADITEPAECEAAANAAFDRYGRVDILANNVGITRPADVVTVSPDEWDALFAVNLKAMMLMSKYVIPKLIESGGGAIINIASTGAVRPPGGHVAYDTAKGGVVSLTIGLAVEQGRNGIRVNCIMPGRMATPMVLNRPGRPPEEFLSRASHNLLGTVGNAWDIAAAAVFLASDDARWITSVTLPVDGGFLHTPPDFDFFEADSDATA